MTNIFEIWEYINATCNKYSNGYLSPEEVSGFLDDAQNSLFNNYLGKRQNGNELALAALQPFYNNDAVTSSSLGLATYPSLWAETQGIYTEISGETKDIKVVLHNELQDALSSVMYPIAQNPRYLEQRSGVQIYPKATTIVDWHYLSSPTTPVIGYTPFGNEVIYDPLTSVQLQFAPQYWGEIIALALRFIGVNLSDQEVSSLGQTFGLNANNGNDGN